MTINTDIIDHQFSLSIDKLSVTYKDHNKERVQRTGDRLIYLMDTGQFPKGQIHPGQRHRIQAIIPIDDQNQKLVLSIGARQSDIADYRVEYNPSKIGPEGRSFVRYVLNTIFEFDATELLMSGKVTRIDIALDMDGLSVDSVLVRHKGMRKFMVVSTGGCPRTLYHGASKANQVAIYDRPDHEGRLRTEKRMKPMCAGRALPELKNPFTRIQIVPVRHMIPYLGGANLEQFCDSVRIRGFRHVLGTLTASQRRGINSVLADPALSQLPSHDLIWSLWRDLLRECGLLDDDCPILQAAE